MSSAARVCGPEPRQAPDATPGHSTPAGTDHIPAAETVPSAPGGSRTAALGLLGMLGMLETRASAPPPSGTTTGPATQRPTATVPGPLAGGISSTRGSAPAARARGLLAVDEAEAALTQQRDALSRRAAAGDPDAQAEQARRQTLATAHERFAAVDLGNGTTAPVPYMVNYDSKTWTDRKTSRARTLANAATGQDRHARRRAQLGKASAAANQTVLQALLRERPWEKLTGTEAATFRTKLARVLPRGARGPTRAAYEVLVYAQVAGLGTDCAGYVQHVLVEAGVIENPGRGLGVGGLTRGRGDAVDDTQHSGRGKSMVARPVDETGRVVVQPGDMMRMSGGGHIGLVHDVVDQGDQVLLRVAHSSPDQAVYGVDGRMGTKPEGLREDLIAWSRRDQRWTAIRAFRSTAALNRRGTISGFFRPRAKTLPE